MRYLRAVTLILIALTNNLCTSPEKNRKGTETAKNQIEKDEATYQKGLHNDRLGKRELSFLIYNSIKPLSQFYWKAQARISIGYLLKVNFNKADSILKTIEREPQNLELPEYLQARWYYFHQSSDHLKALEYAMKNVSICEQKKDSLWLASAYIDLGMSYNKTLNNNDTVAIKKSIQIQEKIKSKLHLSRAYQAISGIYQGKYEFEKSNMYLKKLLIEAKDDTVGLYYTLTGLTTNSFGLKNFTLAEKYIKQAKTFEKKYFDAQQIAYTRILEANIKMAQKQHSESIKIFRETMIKCKKLKFNVGLEWCADGLSKNYEEIGDYKQSLEYRKLANGFFSTLRKEEKTKIIENLNIKYETEKKEKLISIQKIEILERDKRVSKIIFISFCVGLILIAGFLSFRWQQRRRIKQMESNFEQTAQQLQSFNYSVSHDLRHPILGIENALKQLHLTAPTPAQTQLLGQAKQSVANMRGIIDGLLDLASIERNELRLAEVNTEQLVKDILEQMPTQATVLVGSLPTVKADVRLLRQVFVNLISNALKYSAQHPHPQVQVHATQTDSGVRFEVSDNGLGFDEQFDQKLFQLFGRLHPQIEGVGIGLVIVKKIIEKHGGSVWATGKTGEGATFGFEVPA